MVGKEDAVKIERHIKSMKSKTFILNLISDEVFLQGFKRIAKEKFNRISLMSAVPPSIRGRPTPQIDTSSRCKSATFYFYGPAGVPNRCPKPSFIRR